MNSEYCCDKLERAVEDNFMFNRPTGYKYFVCGIYDYFWDLPLEFCPFCGVKLVESNN